MDFRSRYNPELLAAGFILRGILHSKQNHHRGNYHVTYPCGMPYCDYTNHASLRLQLPKYVDSSLANVVRRWPTMSRRLASHIDGVCLETLFQVIRLLLSLFCRICFRFVHHVIVKDDCRCSATKAYFLSFVFCLLHHDSFRLPKSTPA